MIYTAFCQDADERGTIWIAAVDANSLSGAIDAARQNCANDWGYDDPANIHVLGIAEGDVKIAHWEDLVSSLD